ncbi:uncharacterized protein TM35_000751000 [Trypanosoma theileri]|uniref:Uncharacterized protein n=1 Tax=Trypanosoma theileri TaxID=67003 RepID=A0A1X0NFT6_9TRYP|nr:uncharacterized protein TM35_000751000 [Trypanosoma theileri]ORC83333.1 hypothetical protein TM35_000751000 [Trypanosoma theileri]
MTPAPPNDPYIAASFSEVNRIAKRTWTSTVREQRAAIMRGFIEFTAQNNLQIQEEDIPLFIISLKFQKEQRFTIYANSNGRHDGAKGNANSNVSGGLEKPTAAGTT